MQVMHDVISLCLKKKTGLVTQMPLKRKESCQKIENAKIKLKPWQRIFLLF